LGNSEIIRKYEELLTKTIPDSVEFTKTYLDFQPYPYQEGFLRDASPLIAADSVILGRFVCITYARRRLFVLIYILVRAVICSWIRNKSVVRMLEVELAARILSYCSEAELSVSEVVRAIGGSHDKTMALIRELKERSLLLQEISREQTVGRPRQYLRSTPIGEQFVREYNSLRNLCLHSNENDIRKALHQAELTRRLVESGIPPYARFQEINQLARNIASTAKVKQGAR
jgi:predicted transcriptional regulator